MKLLEKIKELMDLCYRTIKLSKKYTIKNPNDTSVLRGYINNLYENHISFPSLFEIILGKGQPILRSCTSWEFSNNMVRAELWDVYIKLNVNKRFFVYSPNLDKEHTLTILVVDRTGENLCEIEATGFFKDKIEADEHMRPEHIATFNYGNTDDINDYTYELYFFVTKYTYKIVKA